MKPGKKKEERSLSLIDMVEEEKYVQYLRQKGP